MKTITLKTLKMQLIALVLLAAFSCKDSNSSTSPIVANDEAADMVSSSVSENSGGMVPVVSDITVDTKTNAGGRIQGCGYSETKDSTRASISGAAITYSFSYEYMYALVCENAIPKTMTAGLTYTGSVNTLRMSAQSAGTGNLSVTTLDASYTVFTINGSYTRNGTFTSKIGNQNTSTSTITITLTDVTVDKTSQTITGGSATISITGTVTGKGTFTYNGSIAFLGDHNATLTIDSTKYSLNLTTGDATAM